MDVAYVSADAHCRCGQKFPSAPAPKQKFMASPHRSNVKWRFEVLPPATKRALNILAKAAWLKRNNWYLAGGTALALQVGHRSSVDLDFFLPKSDFSTAKLLKHFEKDKWETDVLREGTIYGKLAGAKTSFIAYPFFIPARPFHPYGAVPILDVDDIAVMKIVAISQRGRKRDFVDLFWYCTNRDSLMEAFLKLDDQYPTVSHNFQHILKSLTYFIDAEEDPMPKIFFKATWKEIKKFFEAEVMRIARKLYI